MAARAACFAQQHLISFYITFINTFIEIHKHRGAGHAFQLSKPYGTAPMLHYQLQSRLVPVWAPCSPPAARTIPQQCECNLQRSHSLVRGLAGASDGRVRPTAAARRQRNVQARVAAAASAAADAPLDNGNAQTQPAVPPASSIFSDAFGGVTSAIVALPLALAFGVASGASVSPVVSRQHHFVQTAERLAAASRLTTVARQAAGLGPLAGLYGSIFVGFFAAVFGGEFR